MLEIGQVAPDFTLPASNGGFVTLSVHRPKAVVVYFYPKDDTPGCTKEAQEFTHLQHAFDDANAVIFGVSKDPIKKHDKFVTKYDLGVNLLSDEGDDVCERYGTWVEKNMYGKTYMGIERATFLIDSEGKLARIWHKVKVPGHVDEVLEAVRALE